MAREKKDRPRGYGGDAALARGYRAAGFGNRLGFGERPALLLVDCVRAYFVPESPLYAGVEDIVEPNRRLLAAARAAGIPIIFTRVQYQAGGRDGGHFYRKIAALRVFEGEAPLGRFHEALEPAAADIIVTKQYASAFFGTSLAATLTSLRCDTCIITGLSTSGCVRASALDALQYGFVPIVVADACGDRDPRIHESNLFDLAAKYADVMTSNEVLDALASGPGRV